MPFVLDASITVAWAFEDETHPHAAAALDRARTGQTFVPRLWWYEVRNVLIVNERRGRGSPETTAAFLHELASMMIHFVESTDEQAALSLARAHSLTFYDAAYLALALEQGVPLAMLDSELLSAAAAVGVRVVGLSA